MNAGRLRHVVTVQAAVDTQDQATGSIERTWSTLGTVRADVQPGSGRESVFGGMLLSEHDTVITVRYSPLSAQITATHRLLHQGTIFNINRIAHKDLGQREIEIRCTSGVNDG